jgi:hypothetical protein
MSTGSPCAVTSVEIDPPSTDSALIPPSPPGLGTAYSRAVSTASRT